MQGSPDNPRIFLEMGDAASRARDFAGAIRAYKTALTLRPQPEVEMLICWNCALAIWYRAGFLERKDTNTSDEEYEAVLAARALYLRILRTYEAQLEPQTESNGVEVKKLYRYAKDNLVDSKRFCMVSRLQDGTFVPRVIDPDWFQLEEWFQKQ